MFGSVKLVRGLVSWSNVIESGRSLNQLVNTVHGALTVKAGEINITLDCDQSMLLFFKGSCILLLYSRIKSVKNSSYDAEICDILKMNPMKSR